MSLLVRVKGGPGSGNWGHAGRPGKRGGSAPRSVAQQRWDIIDSFRGEVKLRAGSPPDGLSEEDLIAMFSLDHLDPNFRTRIFTGYKDNNHLFIVVEDKSTGKRVLYSERTIDWKDDGSLRCRNSKLKIEKDYMDQGIASDLYERQIHTLREAGFEEISLHADMTIGRYAWAKKGFDYDGIHYAKEATSQFQRWANNQGITQPVGGWPVFKTAHDVATYKMPGKRRSLGSFKIMAYFIDNPDVPSDMMLDLGKAFMLDQGDFGHGSWDGVLKLQE